MSSGGGGVGVRQRDQHTDTSPQWTERTGHLRDCGDPVTPKIGGWGVLTPPLTLHARAIRALFDINLLQKASGPRDSVHSLVQANFHVTNIVFGL